MAFRLLVNAMPDLHIQWQEILIVMAILSMALGNFAAIVQNNLKRMLAYSSIAHMGYMSLGLLSADPTGYAAGLFYMIAYAIMALGGFAFIIVLSHAGFEADNIEDLRGLNERNPWLAFMLLLLMFSMAGIPPSIGFFAKLGVLEALIGVHLIWLAAVALVFAIIGAYYYIRVVKFTYFEAPLDKTPYVYNKDVAVAMTINGLAVLVLGMFPSTLISICRAAFL
jgi:NADH-quinone oxidoreductase subunit N